MTRWCLPPNRVAKRLSQPQQQLGLTVIELLITAAILLILLATLGVILSGTLGAYSTTAVSTGRQQRAASLTQTLRYEIALAGYRGTSSTPAELTEPTLEITRGSSPDDPDQLRLRYIEDRLTESGTPELVSARFLLEPESQQLIREDSQDRNVLAERVANFKVTTLTTPSGDTVEVQTATTPPASATNIGILVRYQDGRERTLYVTLNNPQEITFD